MFMSSYDPFRAFDRPSSWSTPSVMPMDAVRRDDAVEIHLDVPGVGRDDLDISVESNVLTVVAQRRSVDPEDGAIVAQERRSGTLKRQIALADSLDGSQVSAELADGVLTLTVPVAEASKARKVEVTVGSSTPAIEASVTDDHTVDA